MKLNVNVIGIAVGLSGLVYGLYSQSKMNRIASKLNMAVDELDATMIVDVPKNVMKAAMDQAVTREVSQLAKQTASEISEEVSIDMKREVKQAINSKFGEVSERVSIELSNQVAKIDTDALSNKVTKIAEQRIVAKFDGVLDGLVDSFNKDIKKVGKMYCSMNESMYRQNDIRSMFFKI